MCSKKISTLKTTSQNGDTHPTNKRFAKLAKLSTKIALNFKLHNLRPVPNLSYNYVLTGLQDDAGIVLKLSLDSASLAREASALQCFAKQGAVQVIKHGKNFLILEQAISGISLRSYFPHQDLEAVKIACQVMKKLHQANIPTTHNFPLLKDWLAILNKDWEISFDYLHKARSLRDQLLASAESIVLLHGDFHHDNILQQAEDWLIIDPKGLIGESTFDIAAFICNPLPELLIQDDIFFILKTRIKAFSEILQIPQTRLTDWCFIKSILSWAWALEDRENILYWKKMAHIFNNLK